MRKYYSELENLLAKINNSRLTSIVQEVLLDNRDLGLENNKLKEEREYVTNYIDPETGLYNKNVLGKVRDCSSVLLFSIDNLDTYEEQDRINVLRGVAQILFNNSRLVDTVCRYNENEFLIAFVGCDLTVTSNRMEKIEEEIKNSIDSISLSVGGCIVNTGDSIDTVIERARDSKTGGYKVKELK